MEIQFQQFSPAFEALELVGLAFLVLIVAETVWDTIRGNRPGIAESATNFAIFIGNFLLERTAFGLVFIAGLAATAMLTKLSIPATWWSMIMAVILADFSYYWMHRLEHQVRILWAYHSVHHSSPEFNLTTSLRLAWVEGVFEWIFFAPMILLGFDIAQTTVAILIVVTYQSWIHTEKIGKLGWADKIFNTPSVHRVHHGSNKKYHDRNYGGILIIWDRLFGTYQAEEEKVVYGISTPLDSANPLTINFFEFVQIGRSVWQADSVKNALGHVINRPGWHPAENAPDT